MLKQKALSKFCLCMEENKMETTITLVFDHEFSVTESDLRRNLKSQLDCFPCKWWIK